MSKGADTDPPSLARVGLRTTLGFQRVDQHSSGTSSVGVISAWRLPSRAQTTSTGEAAAGRQCVRTARSMDIPEEPESSLAPVRRRLERLTNLARGGRLSGQASTWAGLVAMLEREAAMKPGGLHRKPGFIDR